MPNAGAFQPSKVTCAEVIIFYSKLHTAERRSASKTKKDPPSFEIRTQSGPPAAKIRTQNDDVCMKINV